MTPVSETEHGTARIREYHYGGPRYDVVCGYCGTRAITTRHYPTAASYADAMYRNHICPTFPCGCPVHIVTDEGHQEGCDTEETER